VFEEFLLQRMQFIALRQALNGPDLVALAFGGQHEARTNQTIVDRDTAGAAIAR
jgi:hypothetical protein